MLRRIGHADPGVHLPGGVRGHYAKRRAQVVETLAAIPGVSLPEVDGAFYAFPHIAGLADSAAFTADLLRHTGVALAPGVAFGAAGEGHVRLCFAATEQTLSQALARFRDFMVGRAEGSLA